MPRLISAGSAADVRRIAGEEFDRWFDGITASAAALDAAASGIWDLLAELAAASAAEMTRVRCAGRTYRPLNEFLGVRIQRKTGFELRA